MGSSRTEQVRRGADSLVGEDPEDRLQFEWCGGAVLAQRALHAPLYRAKAKTDMEWNGVNT